MVFKFLRKPGGCKETLKKRGSTSFTLGRGGGGHQYCNRGRLSSPEKRKTEFPMGKRECARHGEGKARLQKERRYNRRQNQQKGKIRLGRNYHTGISKSSPIPKLGEVRTRDKQPSKKER